MINISCGIDLFLFCTISRLKFLNVCLESLWLKSWVIFCEHLLKQCDSRLSKVRITCECFGDLLIMPSFKHSYHILTIYCVVPFLYTLCASMLLCYFNRYKTRHLFCSRMFSENNAVIFINNSFSIYIKRYIFIYI